MLNSSPKVLFIDRDGTLIEEPDDFQVDALHKIRLVDNVIPSLLELARHGFRFVMVSNQDGLGTDAFPQADFDRCQQHVVSLFSSQGIDFEEIFICPHLPAEQCGCRKPRAGLLTQFLARNSLQLKQCAVIGDRETDLELADNIGVRGFLVNSTLDGAVDWTRIVDAMCYATRIGEAKRKTKETDIHVAVNLDRPATMSIDSGIGFFDHMLEQIAKHGAFGLELHCSGDLEIDEHHTVEDSAIALGTAIRSALGGKIGIGRYGFVLPMDESEASVSVDLSGRGAFRFEAAFPRDNVGELSTEMVEHFFRSLAETLGAALHISVQGENTHHMVEATFKAVGRALRQAFLVSGTDLPSTKGTLGA